jgi:hypothetical protein
MAYTSSRSTRRLLLSAALVALCASLVPAVADAETKLCCFNNWRFAGSCVEQIEMNESCGDILGVLNNPMSAAHRFCGGSTIRGGWAGVDCGSRANAGTAQQPSELEPVQPSSPAPARSPRTYTPSQSASTPPAVGAQGPTFITPVDPATTAEARGPSIITLN